MLLQFLYTLRANKIPVGTQEWVLLMDALSQDLAESSLTRFYYLARSLLVKSESLYDAYDQAFLACFKGSKESVAFKEDLWNWLNKIVEPNQRPRLPEGLEKLDLEELRRRFLERMQEQNEEHHGGNRWIGTGGTSPFGHSGAHPSGIRIGGPGGGRMAVKIAEERRFENYRYDKTLGIRSFKVALKQLRRLKREGSADELAIDKSIRRTCDNAGDIELVFEAPRKNQTELLLFMDVGGSMDPYAHLVEELFSAAHASSHFKNFDHYYFHNCIYSHVYRDAQLRERVTLDELFRKYRKSFFVFILGDACMNPYELFAPDGSIDYWERNRYSGMHYLTQLKEHFAHAVWLNPEPREYWDGHPTIHGISKLIKMFPLSVDGIRDAIGEVL